MMCPAGIVEPFIPEMLMIGSGNLNMSFPLKAGTKFPETVSGDERHNNRGQIKPRYQKSI